MALNPISRGEQRPLEITHRPGQREAGGMRYCSTLSLEGSRAVDERGCTALPHPGSPEATGREPGLSAPLSLGATTPDPCILSPRQGHRAHCRTPASHGTHWPQLSQPQFFISLPQVGLILALSTSGINPCSQSPAPNQSLLLLDAHCVGPGVARRSHRLSRCLPGLLRCCHRLPPELFRAGPVPSPAPARRLCYSCEIQSLVPLRDAGAPSPPSHRPAGPPAAGGPAWGPSHLAKQFTGAAQVA